MGTRRLTCLEQASVGRIAGLGCDVINTEHLYCFDGQPGFSLGQGQ